MTEELLMLHGARHAVLQMIKDGNYEFSKRLEDGSCQSIELADICNYLFHKIEAIKEQNNDT